jgi:hypothetical protein
MLSVSNRLRGSRNRGLPPQRLRGLIVEWLRHLGLRVLTKVSERVLITFWFQDRGGYVSGDGRVGEDVENTVNVLVKIFVPTSALLSRPHEDESKWALRGLGTCRAS